MAEIDKPKEDDGFLLECKEALLRGLIMGALGWWHQF